MALGYDAMTGFATIALGEYIGFMAATLNPYTVAVAQSIAGVQLYSGIGYRAVCFVVLMGAAVAYLMLYARKVRRKWSFRWFMEIRVRTRLNAVN